jgi:hypothetical protein
MVFTIKNESQRAMWISCDLRLIRSRALRYMSVFYRPEATNLGYLTAVATSLRSLFWECVAAFTSSLGIGCTLHVACLGHHA